ncbi:hypothetical protein [Burkholderia ubonensis]|uniref:hypothetical protein n=1 Tax=Burkholderia ubonensis TaxID=101571 RepID=UPI0012F90092|nr:hypothetical protein [Burkholderia ubonensis]
MCLLSVGEIRLFLLHVEHGEHFPILEAEFGQARRVALIGLLQRKELIGRRT